MVALGVVGVHEFAQDGAQMSLSEGDDVAEALVLDGTNRSLGVGVEVRASFGHVGTANWGTWHQAATGRECVRRLRRNPLEWRAYLPFARNRT